MRSALTKENYTMVEDNTDEFLDNLGIEKDFLIKTQSLDAIKKKKTDIFKYISIKHIA